MFKEELEKIRKEAQQRLEQSDSLDKINEIRVGVLGKKGSLKDILKGMKNVPAEERPKVGQMVNDVRVEIEEAIAKLRRPSSARCRSSGSRRRPLMSPCPPNAWREATATPM